MVENRRSQADIEDRIESNKHECFRAESAKQFDELVDRFKGDKYVSIIDQNGGMHYMGSK